MTTRDMKIGCAILCLGLGGLAAARGEDLTTLTGQTYSNVVVQQFDRQGLFIEHDGDEMTGDDLRAWIDEYNENS